MKSSYGPPVCLPKLESVYTVCLAIGAVYLASSIVSLAVNIMQMLCQSSCIYGYKWLPVQAFCPAIQKVCLHYLESKTISVPTCTDLSVQVRILKKNPFLYGFLYGFFQKYGFLDFCTDFFKKRPFLKVLLLNSALLQIV